MTWLVGILKHKVIEMIRSHTREVSAPDHAADGDELDRLAFKADGHFVEQPNDWSDPHQTLQQRQLLQVLNACMKRLPPSMGRLVLMREWLELSCEEVCKEFAPTPTDLKLHSLACKACPHFENQILALRASMRSGAVTAAKMTRFNEY